MAFFWIPFLVFAVKNLTRCLIDRDFFLMNNTVGGVAHPGSASYKIIYKSMTYKKDKKQKSSHFHTIYFVFRRFL